MNSRRLGKRIGNNDDILPLRPIDLITGFLPPSSNEPSVGICTDPKDKLRQEIKFTSRLAYE